MERELGEVNTHRTSEDKRSTVKQRVCLSEWQSRDKEDGNESNVV